MTLLILSSAPPTASLSVARDDASGCATRALIAAKVIARLGPAGRDPFRDDAARRATVRIAFERGRFVARIAMHEPDGRVGDRVLVDDRCEPLVEAVALALALAIDPLGTSSPRPTLRAIAEAIGRERRAIERPAIVRAPRPLAPSVQASVRAAVQAGVVVAATIGATPDLLLGPGLRLEIGRSFSGVFETSVGFAGKSHLAGALVTNVRFEARAVGCLDGTIRICGGLAYARTFTTSDAFAEARDLVAVDVALRMRIARGAQLEIAIELPLTPRARFVVDDAVVWRASPGVVAVRLVLSP